MSYTDRKERDTYTEKEIKVGREIDRQTETKTDLV